MIKAKEQEVLVSLLEKRAANIIKGQNRSFLPLNWNDKFKDGVPHVKNQAIASPPQLSDGVKLRTPALTNKTAAFKKITQTEMALCREKGLCYNCDDQLL